MAEEIFSQRLFEMSFRLVIYVSEKMIIPYKRDLVNRHIRLLCTMPRGQSGHSRIGTFALNKYVPLVKNYYEKCFPSGRTGEARCSDSDKCPSGFLEKLKMCDAAWESDNKTLKVKREVKQYGACDKKF